MSLRARLLAALAGLLLTGIVIADLASVAALRSYLLHQIDDELRSAQGPAARRLSLDGRRDPGVSEYFFEVRDASGTIITRIAPELRRNNVETPALTAELVLANAGKRPFTVASENGREKFRAVVGVAPNGAFLATVATPLSDVDRAVKRLVFVEIVVSTVLLMVLVALGYAVIRRDLQPLEDMVDTAGAIAGGDLSRRVERADDTTEVGRLGAALNNMLMQIESSFSRTKASEDRLRRFAADASHELRTPVTAIRGYAEMYRAGAVQGEEHLTRVMDRIEREASRMGSLTEDLLMLARLDQGRPMEKVQVDLNQLATDVGNDAEAAHQTHPITVTVAETIPLILGDPMRLHQALANLVSNAQMHTPAGTPIIIAVSSDGERATVTITDEGPGIEPEALKRVFERFYRADAGRARSEGGTGLGLSIVQALVEAHGGSVRVRSAVGVGTAFEVLLPLAPAD